MSGAGGEHFSILPRLIGNCDISRKRRKTATSVSPLVFSDAMSNSRQLTVAIRSTFTGRATIKKCAPLDGLVGHVRQKCSQVPKNTTSLLRKINGFFGDLSYSLIVKAYMFEPAPAPCSKILGVKILGVRVTFLLHQYSPFSAFPVFLP